MNAGADRKMADRKISFPNAPPIFLSAIFLSAIFLSAALTDIHQR